MKTTPFNQMALIGVFSLVVSSCSYPHPGPDFEEKSATTSPAAKSPANKASTGKPVTNATPTESTEKAEPSDAGLTFDNLEVNDPTLHGKLAVLRVGSQPTANNLLSVFVGMKNKTAHQLDLEVQTIYKDKSGQSLNEGSWIPVSLKAHEETDYHSASISEGAVDFIVRIRHASASQ